MAITLNDFRSLSNGKYNAGQIDFTTETAAEIFSDLVTTNFEAVKNAFTGSFFGPMKIGMAYKSAIGDDKKHMHDGHQKKKTNQL